MEEGSSEERGYRRYELQACRLQTHWGSKKMVLQEANNRDRK